MAFSVQMPALGESVTEGTVTRWLKQEGDEVAVDEPLLEVSTDKVDTEIPSPIAGVLSKIVVGEDETVEVGAELAVISASGEKRDDSTGPPQQAQPSQEDEPATEPAEAPAQAPARAFAQAPSTEQQEPAARPAADTGAPARDGGGTPVTMPALGESVTEGTVTRWLKQVGDSVAVDEPLLEVSTDKVDTEIPSPVAGTVLEINVGEDETAEVGTQLAMIGSGAASPAQTRPDPQRPATEQAAGTDQQQPGQVWSIDDQAARQPTPQPPAKQAPSPQAPAQPQPSQQAPSPQAPAQPQPGRAPAAPATDGQPPAAPYVTPLVRKLATEHDVDLSVIKGTGVGGRIRKQDVLAAADAAKAQPEPAPQPAVAAAAPSQPTPAATRQVSALRGRTEKMSRLRQVIAKRMVESLQTSA